MPPTRPITARIPITIPTIPPAEMLELIEANDESANDEFEFPATLEGILEATISDAYVRKRGSAGFAGRGER